MNTSDHVVHYCRCGDETRTAPITPRMALLLSSHDGELEAGDFLCTECRAKREKYAWRWMADGATS